MYFTSISLRGGARRGFFLFWKMVVFMCIYAYLCIFDVFLCILQVFRSGPVPAGTFFLKNDGIYVYLCIFMHFDVFVDYPRAHLRSEQQYGAHLCSEPQYGDAISYRTSPETTMKATSLRKVF